MKNIQACCAIVLLALAGVGSAQDLPYSEGPVTVVTSVKIMDGQFDNYMSYLQSTYKPVMEAQKKGGIILGYDIYDASPRQPGDADMYLVVSYPNMASFDGLRERTEPVSARVTGLDRGQATKASVERGKMREILGTQMLRELILK
jgi:hypothetical protein